MNTNKDFETLRDRLESDPAKEAFDYLLNAMEKRGYEAQLENRVHSLEFKHPKQTGAAPYSMIVNKTAGKAINFYLRNTAVQSLSPNVNQLRERFRENNITDNPNTSKGHEIRIRIHNRSDAELLMKEIFPEKASKSAPTIHTFINGKSYNRQRDIHDIYGGSRQSGISPSKNAPFIFLFTGGSGEHYGYQDNWEGEIFNYSGHGQEGDMRFVSGNRAIRDHVIDGKDLLLFKAQGKGKPVTFLGEFVCESYQTISSPDKHGKDRRAFVFQLSPAENNAATFFVDSEKTGLSLEALREKAMSAASNTPERKETMRAVTVKERSSIIRLYARQRAGGICECCGAPAPFDDLNGEPYLEVHHIQKLSDNGLDCPENVAAITPNCHRRIHYGHDGKDIDNRLLEGIKNKEREIATKFHAS